MHPVTGALGEFAGPLVVRLVNNAKEWDRALAHVIGTFGVFFGILLALVAVSVYENFAYARQTAIQEASQVGALYRATVGLPEQTGEPLRTALDDYMHAVVELDWPQQQRGVLPEASDGQVEARCAWALSNSTPEASCASSRGLLARAA